MHNRVRRIFLLGFILSVPINIAAVAADMTTTIPIPNRHELLDWHVNKEYSNNNKTPLPDDINLQEIQRLRAAGQLDEAILVAHLYLQKYPTDGDVMLVLGLMYAQQEREAEAEYYLRQVLNATPNYLEARLALIRLKLRQGAFAEAQKLIDLGLILNPNQSALLELRTALYRQETPTLPLIDQIATTKKTGLEDSTLILTMLQELRKKGKIIEAQEMAEHYLTLQPEEWDVKLILGLIYSQQQQYEAAKKQILPVLFKTPTYTDARAALIRIFIFQKEFPQALQLLEAGMKLTPQNPQLLALQEQIKKILHPVVLQKNLPVAQENPFILAAKKLINEKKYDEVKRFLHYLIILDPLNVQYPIALANFYLEQKNDMQALFVILQALKKQPHHVGLLVKEGQIHFVLRQYALAAINAQQALGLEPENKSASGLLDEIKSISPFYTRGRNEISISSDNTYVQDLHSIWDYTTAYITRDFSLGRATGKVNYASRLHQNAVQYEIDLSPRFNRDMYLDFVAAYSDQPALFPNYLTSAEGYVNIPKFFELSAGGKYARITSTYFITYTGSFNLYPPNLWFNFRPYYFIPKDQSKKSLLYTGRVRRYFSTDDHYVGFGAGGGHSPDLADLLTVNFIVIKNSFINADYNFPLFNHCLLVDIGGGFQRWQYPSGLIRRLYDGYISFRYRF